MMHAAAPPTITPKRSRRRWYLVGCFVLLMLATPAIYLQLVGRWREHELEQIYREMDEEDPNWRWADLVRHLPPPPPDERNAMVQLQKVIAILKPTPFGFAGGLRKPTNARLTGADEQRLRTALAALAPNVLPEARKLKDMPESGVALDPSIHPMEVDFDALKILQVTRVLRHDAALDVQNGRMDKSADACLAILNSANAIGEFPHLLGQLVHVAAQLDGVSAIERALAHGNLDEKRLESLQAALIRAANSELAFHAMRSERAFGHEYYLSVRDGRISSEKVIRDLGLDRRTEGTLYQLFPSLLLRGYAQSLKLRNEIVRASKLKDEEQVEAYREIEEKNPTSDGIWNQRGIFIGQLRDLLSDHTRVRCAAAAVAAERYRLKYDHWPASVTQLLKAGLLMEAIHDSYDGKPLRFHPTESGLIVYSIGPDMMDDSGKKGDIAVELWHPRYRAVAPPPDVEAPKK